MLTHNSADTLAGNTAALRRYGKFGYGFGRGSYNITAQQYADAVAAVVSAPLAAISADFAALLRQEPMAALLQHYSTAGRAGWAAMSSSSNEHSAESALQRHAAVCSNGGGDVQRGSSACLWQMDSAG
jgi:hypothetical protein